MKTSTLVLSAVLTLSVFAGIPGMELPTRAMPARTVAHIDSGWIDTENNCRYKFDSLNGLNEVTLENHNLYGVPNNVVQKVTMTVTLRNQNGDTKTETKHIYRIGAQSGIIECVGTPDWTIDDVSFSDWTMGK